MVCENSCLRLIKLRLGWVIRWGNCARRNGDIPILFSLKISSKSHLLKSILRRVLNFADRWCSLFQKKHLGIAFQLLEFTGVLGIVLILIDLRQFYRNEIRLFLLSPFRSVETRAAIATQEFLIEMLVLKVINWRWASLGIAAIIAENIRQVIFIHAVRLLLLAFHIIVEVVTCLSLLIWAH